VETWVLITHAHIPAIDGLRAIAVLAVVLNHFDLGWPASGFLGVDVFFVISGYVISRSLYGSNQKTWPSFLGDFYARRIKRLLPALVACVVLTAIALSMFNPAAGASLKTGIFALMGLSNLYLWSQSSDYFAESSALNAYLHTWSLGVEEQFYLIFPLILWWSGMKIFGRPGARRMLWITGILSVASLVGFVVFQSVDPVSAFYWMPMRFWELGLGALAFAYQCARVGAAPSIGRWWIPLAALFVVFSLPASLSVLGAVLACGLTVWLVLMAGWSTSTERDLGILGHPVMVGIGRVSYSLYLWHWSVLVLSRWTIGMSGWLVPIQLALMGILAVASYRLIEVPLRHARWPGGSPAWVLVAGGGSVATAVVLLWALGRPLSGSLFLGDPPITRSYGVETLSQPYSVDGVSGRWSGEDCVLSSNSDVFDRSSVPVCTIGEASMPRLLILGDSVSAAFVGASKALSGSYGWSVTVVSSWGASPVPEIPNTTAWRAANERYWAELVPALTAGLRAGDQVLLINDLAGYSPRKVGPRLQAKLALYERGLRRFSAELAERGVGLAVVHGYPLVRELNCDPALAVGQWFTPFGSPCQFPERAESLKRRALLDRMLTRLEGEGVIRLIDLFDLFCPGERCTYQAADGALLYRDVFSHPSIEAAEMAGPAIGNRLPVHSN